jgi:hypothetical protein
VLRQILEWTGGQPFLTQKICRLLATGQQSKTSQVSATQLIENQIVENWEAQDEGSAWMAST